MLRAIFLVALAVIVSAEETKRSADQQEFYGAHGLGKGPFCDSQCLPNGDWRMRRDWYDMQTQTEDVFIWMADGDEDFWTDERNSLGFRTCGEYINMLIYGGGYIWDDNDETLEECKPDWIYMFHYDVHYDHGDGHLKERIHLGGSFQPTTSAWNQFIADARNIQDDDDQNLYTQPGSLIRLIPNIDGERIHTGRENDVVFERFYIANYERNFCTFRGSWSPVMMSAKCDFHDDSDESITKYFCNGGPFDYGTMISFDCESDEDCDSIYFGGYYSRKENAEKPRKQVVPASKFLELAASAVSGVTVENKVRQELHKNYGFVSSEIIRRQAREAEEKGEKEKRGYSYVGNWQTQPHSYWGTFDHVTVSEYYYVPYSSNIAAPYCGYRR